MFELTGSVHGGASKRAADTEMTKAEVECRRASFLMYSNAALDC